MKKTLRTLIVVFGIVVLGLAGWRLFLHNPHKMHMGGVSHEIPMADFGPVVDFSFESEKGKTVSRDDLQGKVWVANFIFTRCTGPCPMMSSHMAALTNEFKDAPNINFISFTVDPEYDTADVLKAYAGRYQGDHDRWHFLTGDTERIRETVMEGFRLAILESDDPDIDPGEKINHSLHFVLIDASGDVRGYYNGYDVDARGRLRENLKTLLNEHEHHRSSHT